MITKRTLPLVILIFALGIAAFVYSRFQPKRQEQLDDALFTAVSECVGSTDSVKPIEEALNNGANPNQIYNLGDEGLLHQTPLEIAAANASPGAVKLLLDHHADPNALGSRGAPLHAAVESSSIEIIDLLVQRGANVDAAGPGGETPLIIASVMGKERVVEKLIALKADVSLKDHRSQSALSVAIHDGRRKIVETLRRAGAKE